MEGEACSVQTQEQGPPSAKSSDIVFLNPVISFRPPEVFGHYILERNKELTSRVDIHIADSNGHFIYTTDFLKL